MKDIKGLITVDANNAHYLTCCESLPCVLIDGVKLYDTLKERGGLDSLESQEDYSGDEAPKSKHVEWRIRYAVRNEPWRAEDDFESIVAEITEYALNSEEVRGCYSEMTCGTGDYDFVLNGKHSLLTELASHDGKHVWIVFA